MKTITILIRTHQGREKLLKRLMDSIARQTYKDIKIIMSYEDDEFLFSTIMQYDNVHSIRVYPQREKGETFYNLYCNDLKDKVEDGWFAYFDSDDYLASDDALEKIAPYLNENKCRAVICQMSRCNGKIKPSDEMIDNEQIISGKIGMPCIFVHHTLKNKVDFTEHDNSDYIYIKSISEIAKTTFVKQIVIHSPIRLNGQSIMIENTNAEYIMP